MRNDLFKTVQLSVVAALLAAGCGGAAGEFDADADDVSATATRFYTLQKDERRCAAPACGGYWVRTVKSSADPVYVASLDLSRAGLAGDEDGVRAAPAEELVIKGKVDAKANKGLGALKASVVYRGLPGVVAAANDAFYVVRDDSSTKKCVREPCDNKLATNLLSGATRYFVSTRVERAQKPLVDSAWLVERVRAGEALVAARLRDGQTASGAAEVFLDASQVFVQQPEAPACPQYKLAACPSGAEHTFARDANRCLTPTGCAVRQACTQAPVQCAPGYTALSWAAQPGGCDQRACDPAWAVRE